MRQPLSTIFYIITAFILLSLGCQSIAGLTGSTSDEQTPTPVLTDKPVSTFVPPYDILQVGVDTPTPIETYHISNNHLVNLEILINGQANFPPDLATVQVLIDGQAITASLIAPPEPTANWTVNLLWTGHVPGIYELSLKATDVEGREGEPIVQEIEVK